MITAFDGSQQKNPFAQKNHSSASIISISSLICSIVVHKHRTIFFYIFSLSSNNRRDHFTTSFSTQPISIRNTFALTRRAKIRLLYSKFHMRIVIFRTFFGKEIEWSEQHKQSKKKKLGNNCARFLYLTNNEPSFRRRKKMCCLPNHSLNMLTRVIDVQLVLYFFSDFDRSSTNKLVRNSPDEIPYWNVNKIKWS